MIPSNQQSAVLVLQNGSVFKGISIGAKGICKGEICFNTGMYGYQEIFSDPSYFGQIMVMTSVHIGNYGAHDEECESPKTQIAGLVCRNFSDHHSREQSTESLTTYLLKHNVVGIANIDTRALVRQIREYGAMNALICSDDTEIATLLEMVKAIPSMEGLELASLVSCTSPYMYTQSGDKKLAVIDFGIKGSILKQLQLFPLEIQVFPWNTNFETLQAWNPDAFFLSNGPGDPAVMRDNVHTISNILGTKKPTFGICLGHQLLSLTLGMETYKMHHGHRGINHPVFHINTGKSEITSQNHGFAVKEDSIVKIKDNVALTHYNLNDKTVEGIAHLKLPFFSVQYHPEAGPGPHDARYLFAQFYNTILKHS